LTAEVIFWSKYFSSANEKINNENVAISNDGISVNNPKEIIYFLFAIEPLTLILFLIEFLISIKIIIKKNINKIRLIINRICKLLPFKSIKLLPINVKNVRKANESVKTKIVIIKKFLFNKANII
tara:strand:- start:17 stop:391 length:375 start_codon:yes stop_codon:yes gene_type:complete